MPRRGVLARRSAVEWGIRGALVLLFALLGYTSVAWTLGFVVKARNPARAHALAPGDGRITALLAEKALTDIPGPNERARAAQLSRQALALDAMALPAVTTLGLDAQLGNDTVRARRLFDYAQRLSRRDLKTRIWAIEDAVARGDIPGALRQYDIALRTSRTAPDVLFPVLAGASTEPAIARELARTLAARPAWGANFVDYLAGSGPDARTSMRLFLALRRAGVAVSGPAQAVTITRLLSHDAAEDAWAYYAATHPGADRLMSRDPRFIADPSDLTPFDWVPADVPGLTVSIQRGERGGILDFAAPSGMGGMVVQQMQMLPPGDYRLDGHASGIEQPDGTRPYWALICNDGRELGRVVMPTSTQTGGSFGGRFSVPAGCRVQRLALVVRASDAMAGVSGQVDRVQLRALR